MIKKCKDIVKPQVDETAIECCGIQKTNCTLLSESDIYLGLQKGDNATTAIHSISDRVKLIWQAVNKTFYYYATVSQDSNSAPIANYLENSFSAVFTFARVSEGVFTLTSNTAVFDVDKTVVMMPSRLKTIYEVEWEVTSPTVITFKSYNTFGVLTDGLINKNPLSIKTPRII